MTLRNLQDLVICPKVSYMMDLGICTATAVATRNKIYLIPKEAIGGGGTTVTTTKFTIGGLDPVHAIERWLQEPDMNLTELDQRLCSMITQDWKLPLEKHVLNIGSFSEFKIKAGWFSRGIYYKMPGQRGWRAVAVSGKEYALALQNFYPSNIG